MFLFVKNIKKWGKMEWGNTHTQTNTQTMVSLDQCLLCRSQLTKFYAHFCNSTSSYLHHLGNKPWSTTLKCDDACSFMCLDRYNFKYCGGGGSSRLSNIW